MTKFSIRVQRTTIWPGGDVSVLNTPFHRRVWEIYEDADYYGFSMSFEAAIKVVAGLIRLEEVRRDGMMLQLAARVDKNIVDDELAQMKQWLADQLLYSTEATPLGDPEAVVADAVEYLFAHEMLDLEQIEVNRLLTQPEATC